VVGLTATPQQGVEAVNNHQKEMSNMKPEDFIDLPGAIAYLDNLEDELEVLVEMFEKRSDENEATGDRDLDLQVNVHASIALGHVVDARSQLETTLSLIEEIGL
jgi:hypothetical protein